MEARILIEGEIGAECSLKNVRSQLDNFKEYDSIKVLINSQGGEVDEGFAIHDYLVSLGVPVNTSVVGKCYSIATVIFLAGTERTLSENSKFMIHNPWGGVEGDAKTMEQFATFLRDCEDRLANFYAKKTGLTADGLKSMMDKETFMDRGEAIDLKFANAQSQEFKAVAKLSNQITNNKMDKNESKVLDALNGISDKLSSLFAKEQEVNALVLEGSEELGMNIFVDGETAEVGKAVFVADENGEAGEALEDGTYILADGSSIVVVAGMIEAINEATVAKEEDEEDEEMKALKAELEETKAKLSELEGLKAEQDAVVVAKDEELDAVKNSVNELTAEVEKVKAMTVGKSFAKAPTKTVKNEVKFELPNIDDQLN